MFNVGEDRFAMDLGEKHNVDRRVVLGSPGYGGGVSFMEHDDPLHEFCSNGASNPHFLPRSIPIAPFKIGTSVRKGKGMGRACPKVFLPSPMASAKSRQLTADLWSYRRNRICYALATGSRYSVRE